VNGCSRAIATIKEHLFPKQIKWYTHLAPIIKRSTLLVGAEGFGLNPNIQVQRSIASISRRKLLCPVLESASCRLGHRSYGNLASCRRDLQLSISCHPLVARVVFSKSSRNAIMIRIFALTLRAKQTSVSSEVVKSQMRSISISFLVLWQSG